MYGDRDNIFWTLFYWGIPVLFVIMPLIYIIIKKTSSPKFKKPIFCLKVYSGSLVIIACYHYFRLVSQYIFDNELKSIDDPDQKYINFIKKLESNELVYDVMILWLLLSVVLLIWIKWNDIKKNYTRLKKWIRRKKYK